MNPAQNPYLFVAMLPIFIIGAIMVLCVIAVCVVLGFISQIPVYILDAIWGKTPEDPRYAQWGWA